MLEIYTHSEWLRPFNRFPCILIDRDGYIYDADKYRREWGPHVGSRIGIIKSYARDMWAIYGEEYFSSLHALPAGYLKEYGDGVKALYDENPRNRVSLHPIGYIRENRYYTFREYGRIFSHPDYHVEK